MHTGPTYPVSLRLAAAYSPRTPHPSIQPGSQQRAGQTADRVELSSPSRATISRARSLIAATVPGPVNFDAATPPRPDPEQPLQLYTHPAARNSAATGIEAGRLDVSA